MKTPIFILLAIIFCGCGRAKPQDKGATTGSSLFATSWVGYLSGTTPSGQLIDPMSVRVNLASSKEFSLAAAGNINRYASGKFVDMPASQTLSFEIADSTISEFGAANSTRLFNYERLDNEMVLKNGKQKMTLQQSEDGDTTGNPFERSWVCEEKDWRWSIDIDSSEFVARRAKTGEKALNLSGAVFFETTTSNERIAKFKVLASNPEGSEGAQLLGTLKKEDSFEMMYVDKDGKKIQGTTAFLCKGS